MCCHTEKEVADQTFYLTQSQYTDTGPTSPSADPMMPGTWQGSHQSANFWATGMTQAGTSWRKWELKPRSAAHGVDALTTRPMRRWMLSNQETNAQTPVHSYKQHCTAVSLIPHITQTMILVRLHNTTYNRKCFAKQSPYYEIGTQITA